VETKKMKYNDVKRYIEETNLDPRKDRYLVMEKYFGVGGGTIKNIISFDRYLRMMSDVDLVGLEKEKEWRPSGEFKKEETRLNIELPRII
jgi:hypothetical protein